jgi:hypothetical protein
MLFTCSPGLIENERSISAGGNHGKYKSVTWLNSTEPWVGHCCPTCSRPSSASASTPMYCWTRSTETISFSVSAKEVIKSLSSPMMGVEYDKPRPTWTKNKSHPNPTILIPPILRSSIHPSRSIPSRNLSALFLFGGMEGRKAF